MESYIMNHAESQRNKIIASFTVVFCVNESDFFLLFASVFVANPTNEVRNKETKA